MSECIMNTQDYIYVNIPARKKKLYWSAMFIIRKQLQVNEEKHLLLKFMYICQELTHYHTTPRILGTMTYIHVSKVMI